MKTIVIYYSFSGNTKALAYKKAQELGADIEEIIEVKRPIMPIGIHRAVNRVGTEIHPIESQLDDYDEIIIMSPVWAEHPVSAIYSLIDCLPKGKSVELVMVSGGGGTRISCEGTKALVVDRGCEVVRYTDVTVKVNRKTGEVTTKALEKLEKGSDLSYLVPIVMVGGIVLLLAVAYVWGRMNSKRKTM